MLKKARVLKAEAFVLLDSEGRERARLHFDQSGQDVLLEIRDKVGRVRSDLVMAGYGDTFVSVRDKYGENLAMFGVVDNGAVGIELNNVPQGARVSFGLETADGEEVSTDALARRRRVDGEDPE